MGKTLERLGGDEQLLHEVIEAFLDEGPKHLTSLREAITEGSAEAVEAIAHTLGGELGYLGIAEVSRKAREMEKSGRSSDLQLAASLCATFEPQLSEVFISMRRVAGGKPDLAIVAGPPGVTQ